MTHPRIAAGRAAKAAADLRYVHEWAAEARRGESPDHEFISYLVDQCAAQIDRRGHLPGSYEAWALARAARAAEDDPC